MRLGRFARAGERSADEETSVLFTADNHFGHRNIIALCSRPFVDVAEMDEAMVYRWNSVVGAREDIWHLGDFACRSSQEAKTRLFHRLNGRKRLIIGNHDNKSTIDLPWVEQPVHFAMVKVEGSRVALCHYGLRVWPGVHHGTVHLYGHSHGRLPGNSLALDIGVDSWAFTPVSIDEIRGRLAALPPYASPEVAV